MSEVYTLEHIQFPRSFTPNAVPISNKLAEGALGLNLTDKAIYSLDSGGNVVMLAKNYDAILETHFTAKDPHGVTPLYHINPLSLTLNVSRGLTEIDRWGPEDVTYTISNNSYAVGDKIDISRCNALTGGEINISITGGQYLIKGVIETEDQTMGGDYEFITHLRKVDSNTWLVKVNRI